MPWLALSWPAPMCNNPALRTAGKIKTHRGEPCRGFAAIKRALHRAQPARAYGAPAVPHGKSQNSKAWQLCNLSISVNNRKTSISDETACADELCSSWKCCVTATAVGRTRSPSPGSRGISPVLTAVSRSRTVSPTPTPSLKEPVYQNTVKGGTFAAESANRPG